MKITADTNILIRAMVSDDARQTKIAQAELASAELVVVTLPVLCELVWVLAASYKVPAPKIAEAIRRLIGVANVKVNAPAVQAGLALMDDGGDFADGVIAYEGRWQGSEIFVSFDKQAVRLLHARGEPARVPV